MKPRIFLILYYLQILRLFPAFYFHYELRKHIKKDDVVIDIGANWGCYTNLFMGWGARTYAVEPISKFYYMLECTEKFNYALGDGRKEVYLSQWRSSDGAYKLSDKGEQVTMVKGSWLFEEIDKINFIKIDVEESELPIIKDMKDLIEKHKPMILIETGFIRDVLNLLPSYNVLDSFHNEYLLCS